MKKYIKPYSELVTESIDRGAIVLIKGKSEGDKKKLYAAHVIGSVSIAHGGQMLFLADEFYRIREEDGKLKAAKIAYKSDATLKSALNLKSPGKISIVKNNNKTPFHWKTLKHTTIHSALREVESDLQKEEYLFESVDSRDSLLDEYYDLVISKTIDTAFLGEKKIDIFKYKMIDDIFPEEPDDDGYVTHDWGVEFTVMLRGPEFKKYTDRFSFEMNMDTVTFTFNSNARVIVSHDPGDYWTPEYTDVDIEVKDTRLSHSMVDGNEVSIDAFVEKINKKLPHDIDPHNLEKIILKNLENQFFIKKED